MRSVRRPHPLLQVACCFAGFAGGPALGIGVAHWVAPGSELAQIVSPLAFALAFAAGLLAWFGLGFVATVGGALVRMLRGRWRWRAGPPASELLVPPGYAVFLPLGIALGLAAGSLVGVATDASLLRACAAYAAAGAAYGASLRALAHRGYLPFPEPG